MTSLIARIEAAGFNACLFDVYNQQLTRRSRIIRAEHIPGIVSRIRLVEGMKRVYLLKLGFSFDTGRACI